VIGWALAWLAACSERPGEGGLLPLILAPSEGEQFLQGESVWLAAEARWGDGSAADPTFTWTSSLSGPLGGGSELSWTPSLSGEHAVSVVAEQAGVTGEATVSVWVRQPAPNIPSIAVFGPDQGVPDGLVWHDLAVSGGRLLGATSSGLLVFDGETATLSGLAEGLAADVVHAVLDDGQGQVWVGYEGLEDLEAQRLNLDAGVVVEEDVHFDRTGEIHGVHRFAIEPAGQGAGNVWMATNEGMCVYDRELDVYAEHTHPVHPHLDSLGVAFTSDGTHWNGDQHQLSRWTYDFDGALSSTSDLVAYDTLWEVPAETVIGITDLDAAYLTVWVASSAYGVARVDVTDLTSFGTVTFPVDLPSALAIRVDADGLVWIGAPDGLYVFDPATDALSHPGEAWMPGPAVQQIAIDDRTVPPIAWLATSSGLVRLVGVPE
jgi:hypothetical protein